MCTIPKVKIFSEYLKIKKFALISVFNKDETGVFTLLLT